MTRTLGHIYINLLNRLQQHLVWRVCFLKCVSQIYCCYSWGSCVSD